MKSSHISIFFFNPIAKGTKKEQKGIHLYPFLQMPKSTIFKKGNVNDIEERK